MQTFDKECVSFIINNYIIQIWFNVNWKWRKYHERNILIYFLLWFYALSSEYLLSNFATWYWLYPATCFTEEFEKLRKWEVMYICVRVIKIESVSLRFWNNNLPFFPWLLFLFLFFHFMPKMSDILLSLLWNSLRILHSSSEPRNDYPILNLKGDENKYTEAKKLKIDLAKLFAISFIWKRNII